jgi:hypothetical protein
MSLTEKIEELLANPPADGTLSNRQRPTYPNGWEPGVRWDSESEMTVTTDLTAEIANEDQWREAVEALGLTLPPGWSVVPVEARFDPASWQRDEQGEDAVTRPTWRYKFKIQLNASSAVSVDELIAVISRHKRKKSESAPVENSANWLLATGDWQLGKMDGDGAEGTIERILEGADKAVDRIRELKRLKRWPGAATLALTGDCVEGFLSQNGGNIWRTRLTMTEQVRLYRRLVMQIIVQLSKEVDTLLVTAVPGNHGETVRVAGKMATRMDDSWDLDSVVAVAEALAHNPDAYGHVAFHLPQPDQGEIVLDLAGTVTAIAHGHQAPRGDVPKWVAEHAKNMAPVGDAHLIITGHHHHLAMKTLGPRTWIQVPAMESKSDWWEHRTGEVSMPGMVSLLTSGGHWSDLAIL